MRIEEAELGFDVNAATLGTFGVAQCADVVQTPGTESVIAGTWEEAPLELAEGLDAEWTLIRVE